MESDIRGVGYTRRKGHTEGETHAKWDTYGVEHIRSGIHTEWNTHGVEHTRSETHGVKHTE